MARMPGAVWLGEHSPKTPMSHYDIVCIHTIVGYAPAHAAHFSTRADGTIEQSRDTKYRSAANLNGNHRVLAIENEDAARDIPLSAAQVESCAKILAWAHREHGIPLRLCPDSKPGSRGLAYHRQGVTGNFAGYQYPGRVEGGELWSESYGKLCPRDKRIAQLPAILARAKEIVRGEGVDLIGVNAAWQLPRDERRALIREATDFGAVVAGVEAKWLDVQRILGDSHTVLQGEGEAYGNLFLALNKAEIAEHSDARWSIGTTPDMKGFPTAKMLTRPILEADVKIGDEWRTVMVAHFPPKRYAWLYARMLKNLRRRMSASRYPVLVFADWNRYAAAVATGTGLSVRVREVVGWAFTPGQSVSPARRVDVGGDHPGIAITAR